MKGEEKKEKKSNNDDVSVHPPSSRERQIARPEPAHESPSLPLLMLE